MQIMKNQRFKMAVRLLTCLLILAAVAVQRNGSLFGHDFAATPQEDAAADSPIMATEDGAIIYSATIAKDIKGYGGSIPLQITVKDGKIAEIVPEKNAETPDFFTKVETEVIPKWIGVPVDDVAATDVDAVTGATLSSNAVNATVKASIAYAAKELGNLDSVSHNNSGAGQLFTVKNVAALIVILMAMILPLFVHNNRYRYLQLAINVVVLGFWCATFLSYSLMVNYLSNGVNLIMALPWILMLVSAFIYPYFGKKSHYCAWICPLGSLQELAGKSVKYKLKLPPSVAKGLACLQEWLWMALMFVMCAGIYFSWMDYELFSAFLFRQAGTGILIATGVFILLSFVVPRPYCRFVCPTGCLFQISQNTDQSNKE